MASRNKLFAKNNIVSTQYTQSRKRYSREYLISDEIADEFNTYHGFSIFRAYNDIFTKNIDSKSYKETQDKGPGVPSVRSLFNRAGAIMIGGQNPDQYMRHDNVDAGSIKKTFDEEFEAIRKHASEWRIYNNVPLMDSTENRQRIRAHSGCTVKELVNQSAQGLMGRAIYSYADFMYCKYLGRIPNNYLITLRRFPIPPGDNITALGVGSTTKKEGKNRTVQQQGCLVTWLGTPGNEMDNILKYTVTMPYQEKSAKMQDLSTEGADQNAGILNGMAAAFDKGYRRQYQAGQGGTAFNGFVNKFLPPALQLSNGHYPLHHTDGNKIYGPVDRVKKIYMRGEEGIDFKQDITLTFDYELRSYNGINTRQAFLDLLANILNVTYTTGSFWGGGYRGGGMHQNSIFNNLEIFKARGGYSNFMDAFRKDCSTIKQKASSWLSSGNSGMNWSFDSSNPMESLKNIASNVSKLLSGAADSFGGMLMSGLLNKLGRPQRAYADSLLSEKPTGMWHIMIGNPKHPIMSMGNMVLKSTTIQHYGPLGLDDFPTGLRVVCTLDRGKGRDLRDIEALYMHGNDRIYSSMDSKVFEIYTAAQKYRYSRMMDSKGFDEQNGQEAPMQGDQTDHSSAPAESSPEQQTPIPEETTGAVEEKSNVESGSDTSMYGKVSDLDAGLGGDLEKESAAEADKLMKTLESTRGVMGSNELALCQSILQETFGETDTYSIYFPAAEQAYGASPQPSTAAK